MKIFDRIAKRSGLYVSRPVLNADAWAKWAEKYGVPNPVAAADMHVTVIASRTDVKVKPQSHTVQVYSTEGRIGFLGLDESVLTFLFWDWCLTDRNWFFLGQGAVSDWPEYRPHVTLSYDAKGFEVSDEALAAMPPSMIFGPEVFAPFAPDAKAVIEKGAAFAAGPDLAAAAVAAEPDLVLKGIDPIDRQTLLLMGQGAPLLQKSADRLFANHDGLLERLTKGQQPQTPEPNISRVLRSGDEERMVYGWASVSKINGENVVDSHRDEITTDALLTLTHEIIKGSRAGKFDHAGAKKSEIVEGLVFRPEIWAGIADTLEAAGALTKAEAAVVRKIEFEGALLGFHCADDDVWDVAKASDFELSIGCDAFVEPIQE
jgi:hypothetical protein